MKLTTKEKLEERTEQNITIKDFASDESGMGTVEVILIIVVLIGLVIIFKDQIRDLVNRIFETITDESNTVLE